MRQGRIPRTLAALATIAAVTAAPACAGEPPEPAPRPAGAAVAVDHSALDALLRRYVAQDGVRYGAWSASDEDRIALRAYLGRLAASRPSALSADDGLAYWINAYNALTLNLVLDHYPVESIKDIRSPWKRKVITVEERQLSLDQIENDVIRKLWAEPRIHFALNCASVDCPPLRPEAYTGGALELQLEEQTRAFLSNPRAAALEADGDLRLSRIFRWYREDFERDGGALLDWVRAYLPALEGKDPDIDFAGYDWALNEAAEPSAGSGG